MGSFNRTIVFLLILVHSSGFAQKALQAQSGTLDARSWNFANDRLPLSCYWTMYENKLIDPKNTKETGVYIYFPALFNAQNEAGNGVGYATYKLLVLVPDTITRYAVEVPQMYNSYKFWINNELIASSGKVGTTERESRPQWRFQIIDFKAATDTLHIVLQVANFHHYKGGATDPIYLGIPSRIKSHWSWALSTNLAEIVFLFIEAIVFLILYLYHKDKNVILFFACLCFTWSIRAVFSNLYPIVLLFPNFNWTVLVRIEYLTLFSGVIWSILFLNHLFRNMSTPIVTYLLVTMNIFFIIFTLFSPPHSFSAWINVYLVVAGITVLYGGIIIIKALLSGQAGAWFLMVSILCAISIFGYDLVSYGSASGYNHTFLHIGYIIIFMLVTFALLLHLKVISIGTQHSDMLTYNDMFGTKD